jgi:hypothetical protein
MNDFYKRNKVLLFIIGLSFLCWGGLILLKGLWVDDWAWVWMYFESKDYNEFIEPWRSLRKVIEGSIWYVLYHLFEIFKGTTSQILNTLKFVVLTINAFVLYTITKNILRTKTILPETIATVYLVSPAVNNLWPVNINYDIELCFFFLSVLFTIKYLREDNLKRLNYFLSFLLASYCMMALGSYIPFEILRPTIVLYIILKEQEPKISKAIKRTALFWAPFLLIGIAVFIDTKIRPQYGPYAGLYELKPLSLLHVRYYKSLRYFMSLYNPFNLGYRLEPRAYLAGISFLASCVSCLFLSKFGRDYFTRKERELPLILAEIKSVLFFAIFSFFVGLTPYVLTRESVSLGDLSRFAILANVGFSIFIAAFLLMLYYKRWLNKQVYFILLGCVIFMGVYQCRYVTRDYDIHWREQQAFWSKFIKRVPDIKENTFLVIDFPQKPSDYFPYRTLYTYIYTAQLNFLYARSRDKKELNKYFVVDATHKFAGPEYFDKKEVGQGFSFKGVERKFYPKNLLVASYHGGEVYLNHEINESNISGRSSNMSFLVSKSSPGQIIGKDKAANDFPLRWIIE